MAGWVGSLQRQLDSWQRLHSQWSQWPPWNFNWKWPWQDREDTRREARRLKQESQHRKEQIESLCRTVKVESIADLQDLLGAMVLSECVYKQPDHDLVRAVNKFKADFGGQLVSVDRIQASLGHVPHRYLLAEGRDTLFASFVGTNHYKDVIADANVLQGALFNEEEELAAPLPGEEDIVKDSETAAVKGLGAESQLGKTKQQRLGPKPAAHRGFLGRAKGIPAVEIYQLAQRKEKKLVLCGHSLGGAVAVLTTLAILRVFSGSKPNVKCITFSQPPVGNRALRDYVHRSGWQQHFQTYCIPEDVVPRILSPAYFQHFHEGGVESKAAEELPSTKTGSGNERMALGLGPIQTSIWRLSRLVPLVSGQQWLKGRRINEPASAPSSTNMKSGVSTSLVEPFEIQEDTEGVSLVPLPPVEVSQPSEEKSSASAVQKQSDWRKRVLALPSYIPFGQLFLLEKSVVQPLSASEYTRLTSMQSVLMELRDRFQSHTMKSYRSRFQRIYELCLGPEAPSPVLLMEHLPHIPHLRQWLGVNGTGMAEVCDIAEPLSIKAATSVVPLGWGGTPGDKACQPFKVDIHGYGLHLCTLVQAQVNGRWCSTKVESPPVPPIPDPLFAPQELQRLRVSIGPPLPSSAQANLNDCLAEECITRTDASTDAVEGLDQVTVYCSSDFKTSAKTVTMRLRRVRLLGLEGAGKTSLFYALMGQGRFPTMTGDGIFPDTEWREGTSCGVNYVDAAGVNLQDLPDEVEQLRQELFADFPMKMDMVVLVHNLAHKIPRSRQPSAEGRSRPALALLLDEITGAGVPVALALTNKFAVSAERRQVASIAAMEAYQVRPDSTVVVNSCPYTVRGNNSENLLQVSQVTAEVKTQGTAQKLISAPINLVQMPFRRKEETLPVEGVRLLRELVHSMLLEREEAAFEDMRRVAMERQDNKNMPLGRPNPQVGAAIGAGLGVLVAIVTGAAAALRKP